MSNTKKMKFTYADAFRMRQALEREIALSAIAKQNGDEPTETKLIERLQVFKRLTLSKLVYEEEGQYFILETEIRRKHCLTDPETGAILRNKHEFKDKNGNVVETRYLGYQYDQKGEAAVEKDLRALSKKEIEVDCSLWPEELKEWVKSHIEAEMKYN